MPERCQCGGLIHDAPGRVAGVGGAIYAGGPTCEHCFPEAMPDTHIFERDADKQRQRFGEEYFPLKGHEAWDRPA